VVETVADVIGRPDLLRLGAKPMPANEPPRLYADVGRLRNEVGWRPQFDLRGGLEDTVAWWGANRAA
jgi:nucleoside-diphosphate-sugar epimerase